jgi:hypothetical protein
MTEEQNEKRELLKQLIMISKRIDELDRKINGLMKDIEGDYKKII